MNDYKPQSQVGELREKERGRLDIKLCLSKNINKH